MGCKRNILELENLPTIRYVRVYDPLIARFLSPDNYVQLPDNSQGFNRYSYCLNNPLIYTDPSGFAPRPGNNIYDPPAPYNPNITPQYFIDGMKVSGFEFRVWSSGGGNIASVDYIGNLSYMGIYPGNVSLSNGSVMSTSQSISIRTSSQSFRYHWNMANKLQSQGMLLRVQEYNPGYTINYVNPATSQANIGSLYSDMYLNYTEAALLVDMLNSRNGQGWMPGWATDANTGIGIFNAVNGLKSELIEYAVRSNYQSARAWSEFNNLKPSQKAWRTTNTLGKTGASYLKYIKGLGYVGAGLTTTYSVANAGMYYYNGGTDWQVGTKATLDVIMTGVSFLGPIGFGISATYFILDATTGGFGGFGQIKP